VATSASTYRVARRRKYRRRSTTGWRSARAERASHLATVAGRARRALDAPQHVARTRAGATALAFRRARALQRSRMGGRLHIACPGDRAGRSRWATRSCIPAPHSTRRASLMPPRGLPHGTSDPVADHERAHVVPVLWRARTVVPASVPACGGIDCAQSLRDARPIATRSAAAAGGRGRRSAIDGRVTSGRDILFASKKDETIAMQRWRPSRLQTHRFTASATEGSVPSEDQTS
jgi:hypothetical protein